jgi:hypothetical protein
MKTQIIGLLESIGGRMQEELANKNFGEVSNLAVYLKKTEGLLSRARTLEAEYLELEAELGTSNATEQVSSNPAQVGINQSFPKRSQSRAENKTMRIEIDWHANGRPRSKEVIASPMAADGMATFLARIIEELGPESLNTLAQIRINRGPLISKSPAEDFTNRKNGKTYNHKEIGTTGYYVLTNNQTSEKIDALKYVCRKLGLVPGSVKFTELSKKDLIIERYLSVGLR